MEEDNNAMTTTELEQIQQMIREMADVDDDDDDDEESDEVETENPPPVREKKTRGQQKVKLEKMTNPKQLGVTFAKRRGGLCKKTDAIAGLTGAELGFLVFSPTGKPFTYGSPDADTIIDRYIAGAGDFASSSQNPVALPGRVPELEAELASLTAEVETEKKRRLELRKQRKEMQMKLWWAYPYHRLLKNQQEWFKTTLEQMHRELTQNNQVLDDASNITTNIDQSLMMVPPAPAPVLPEPPMPAVMDDTQTTLNPYLYQNQIQSMLEGNYMMMPAPAPLAPMTASPAPAPASPGLPPLPDELYWNGEYMGGFGGPAAGYY